MKLKGTYIDALPQLVNPETGRVHTCFNQAVAATGRLSSSDPNLQNIPIRTELGREIRRAFIAEPGYVLISADYSQIELRVLAHLADDETLIEAFRRGDDIHDQTALKVFGPDSAMDKHVQRSTAKMINYALLYGKTAFTLAKDIGVTPQAAQEIIDAYFAGFPRVRQYIDRTLEEARVTGVVKTMFGRRRLVPELTSRDFQRRSSAEREAVNMPIQGTAADIMKRAMLQVHAALAIRSRRADDPDGPRRAAVRGPESAGGGDRRARPRADGVGGGPEGAAHGRRRDRRELERRQTLMADTRPEVWLRGPVSGITPILQPVAHALLQAREEVEAMMANFPEEQLWSRPAGVASPGFHLQHLSGVLTGCSATPGARRSAPRSARRSNSRTRRPGPTSRFRASSPHSPGRWTSPSRSCARLRSARSRRLARWDEPSCRRRCSD